ncbi:MAG: HAMP domain-containing histidine kinase [Candidatus Syntrophosphaera sp.]|nr:HAMP domain-containing histidine kinase [Candidatus Syntrophosphaera sp.]
MLIFAAFAVYTQILIQNAKREQEHVPRIFAKYIAYTDAYLRQSEKYAQTLGELSSKHFESAQQPNYEEAISSYILFEFMPNNPIPIIITDANLEPLFWNQVGVSPDSSFVDLCEESQRKLKAFLPLMNCTEISYEDEITNFVYYARPTSLQEFIKQIDYSLVVTDRHKTPLYWRNVGIPEAETWAQISSEERAVLRERILGMDEMPLGNEADNLGYIYFSAPKSLSRIRYFVILELALAILLIGFSSYGLLLLHRTEKDTLWIGLAKETAHQFGTPITSMMGWLDLLRETPPEGSCRPDMNKILDYMTTDLEQLKIISSRFGKVGSQTKLKPLELHRILEETVSYFHDRMPHLSSRIEIHLISKIEGIMVMLDAELFKWTLENLIKNCVDAMSGKGGNIVITATHNAKHVFLHIRDEGKGIPHSRWKKIFDPGVTTKTRGWGLGLSLAKRIIEEYHHGHIRVLASTINEGTTFEIKLHTDHAK